MQDDWKFWNNFEKKVVLNSPYLEKMVVSNKAEDQN